MSQATLNGILLDDGGEPCQCRFRYGITPALGLFTPYVAGVTTGMAISATVLGLARNRTYYFQAEAVNSAGTSLGAVLLFTTPVSLPPSLRSIPTVVTRLAQDILRYVATLNGTLTSDGGQPCSVGFEWGIDTSNLSSSLVVGTGISLLPFSVVLYSFIPNTTYYFRAFATNSAGTGYGAINSFTTEDVLSPIPGLPGTPEGPPVPPLGTLPPLIPGLPSVPPVQTLLGYINIGLAIGGAAGLILIISAEEKRKKKEKEEAIRSL